MTTLATYRYLGTGTIAVEDYVASQTKLTDLDSGGNVVWLDRFGRVADQVWEHYYLDGSGNEIADGTPDAYAYGYDRAGNRTSRENLTKTDGTLDESYTYDGLDRLTEWDVNSVTQQTWSLDGLGNDLSTGTYSAVNEETPTVGSSGYDAAGNMTTLPNGQTAIYDGWNRMTEVDDTSGIVQQNAYDGTNRRIQVYTDFTGTTPDKVADDYLAGQQVIETDQTTGGFRAGGYQTIWSPRYIDAPILRDTLTTSGTGIITADRLFYLGDANYNVTGLMKYNSVSGEWEAVERYTYTPYGTVTVRDAVWVSILGNVSQFANTTLYTGRVFEPATGLMYYRARYYDTGLERFVTKDPIGATVNFYHYCSGRPVASVDPMGLSELKAITFVKGAEPTFHADGPAFIVQYYFDIGLLGSDMYQQVNVSVTAFDKGGKALKRATYFVEDLAELQKAETLHPTKGKLTFASVADRVGLSKAGKRSDLANIVINMMRMPNVCSIDIAQNNQWMVYHDVKVLTNANPGTPVSFDGTQGGQVTTVLETETWEGEAWGPAKKERDIHQFLGIIFDGEAVASGGLTSSTKWRLDDHGNWAAVWTLDFMLGIETLNKAMHREGKYP